MLADIQRAADNIEAEGVFLGCPKPRFARGGRNQLIVLLDQGLTPDCSVLDIGCGCLRAGYWIMNFLDSGNYYGIEPNMPMIDAGRKHLLPSQLESDKHPSYSSNDEFDFSVFHTTFDYFVARSVWSHATQNQIETMLKSFIVSAAPGGKFLTSYKPSTNETNDNCDHWVGRSHRSDTPGLVSYSFQWIRELCESLDLAVYRLYTEFGQEWIRIERKTSRNNNVREPRKGRLLGFTDLKEVN